MKNKSNEAIKNYRGEIIVGLVTSAIWFSLEWIIKSAPKTGKNVLATIQNFIYSCAAKVSLTYIISIILSIILGVFTVIAIFPLISSYTSKKSKMKMKEMEERIDKLKKAPNEKDKKIIIDFLDSEKEKLEKRINRSGKIMAITVILYLLFILFTMAVPLNLLNTFEYNIKMIKPYTDNKTVIMLESDWTRMRSKDDYDKIYETINIIKEDNNLPKK